MVEAVAVMSVMVDSVLPSSAVSAADGATGVQEVWGTGETGVQLECLGSGTVSMAKTL